MFLEHTNKSGEAPSYSFFFKCVTLISPGIHVSVAASYRMPECLFLRDAEYYGDKKVSRPQPHPKIVCAPVGGWDGRRYVAARPQRGWSVQRVTKCLVLVPMAGGVLVFQGPTSFSLPLQKLLFGPAVGFITRLCSRTNLVGQPCGLPFSKK